MSIADRKIWVRKTGLCFGCLNGNHIAKSCKNRKKCRICSQLHPTPLHGDRYDNKRDFKSGSQNVSSRGTGINDTTLINSLMSNACSGQLNSMIVPVYIFHESCPENKRIVYALLDSQSDTTFILDKTCEALNVTGVDVDISLSTMYAENKIIHSENSKACRYKGSGSRCPCLFHLHTHGRLCRSTVHIYLAPKLPKVGRN